MSDYPERISISPVHRHIREDDFYLVDRKAFPGKSVEYVLTTHALAMVAAAYGEAAQVCNDIHDDRLYGDTLTSEEAAVALECGEAIRAIPLADASAALDAMLKAERVKALREAADCIGHITQAEDREAINALIEKETDHEY